MIETLYLPVITVAELRFGLAAMPAGKRRTTYLDRTGATWWSPCSFLGRPLPAYRWRIDPSAFFGRQRVCA